MVKKAALLLFSVVVVVGGAMAVRGQSALDGFDPNADGLIRVVVVQPDGKILIGGDFTTVSPNGVTVARNRIARFNTDGSVDMAFDPNVDEGVSSITVQADGKILVGGFFSSIGGQTRWNIGRLDPVNGLADSFNPNPNPSGFVVAIAVQADGKILVGGYFTSIGGQERSGIARLDPATGLADSFDPRGGSVDAIAVQADGKILAGGDFTYIGGATRNHIARLDPTTGLADSFDPNADGYHVLAIAVQADGKILAGGYFTGIGGQARNHIARLDPTTGLADSLNPNANARILSIVVQRDGNILVGGDFFGSNSIGGQSRNRICRLNATTGLVDSFDPNANGEVRSIAIQADGKILAGGAFTTLAPNGGGATTRNRIARLEADGRLDRTLDLGLAGGEYTGAVTTTAVQADGKILIAGDFTNVLGVARRNIARLNTDGTVDTAFDANANSDVDAIAVQPDGKIVVGGNFHGVNSIGGQPRNYIARLDATTGLADSFDPNANFNIWSIAVQMDGKVLAGGHFTSIGGQARNKICRVDGTTGLADSFNPNANDAVMCIVVQDDGKILAGGFFRGANGIGGQTRNHMARLDAITGLADSFDPNAANHVTAIALQPDGKILVGGFFTNVGGQPRSYIARLDATTGLADSFNPNANDGVHSIAVQADGKVIASGFFTNIGGQTRNKIGRVDGTTGLADSFDPNPNGLVLSVAVQPDGKILAGGVFNGANSIGGQTRSHFARLTNDSAALQNLAATQTTLTWTRGGSSPQLTRVIFEYSADNLNYVPLGNGTGSGSNWTLTGLSLPTEQAIYIRARGYYRGGFQNGSESITEAVRNAFIAGSTPTPSGRPTPTPEPTPILTPTPTPTPSPTPTPTLTPTPTPVPSPTPTATPTLTPPPLNISGTISNCSNPVPGPVSDVTLTLTGDAGGLATTDGSGNYAFLSLAAGGNYNVTPTKAALTPASAGINTVDAIAAQRHFLNLGTPLSGCSLTAADVNGNAAVDTVDVIAIQRFFLGLTTGIANTGKYQFNPANRTYSGIVSDQIGQNYDTLIFGDVAAPFTEPPAAEVFDPNDRWNAIPERVANK